MLVGTFMTAEPVTVAPETSLQQALHLMHQRRVRRFPVLNAAGRLVGIVSEKDLLNAAPSPATPLAQRELQAMMTDLTVGQVMTPEVIAVSPDVPLEEAARLMADNKIGGLPVLDEQHWLIGIITETDVFRSMLDLLGARRPGLRVTFEVEDQRGTLAKLAGEVTRQGGNLVATAVYFRNGQDPIFMIKAQDVDRERLLATLRGAGAVLHDARMT
jgi:acetoin utilization protein AcuB